MSDFSNNLRVGDTVLDTDSRRQGEVVETSEHKRNIRVKFPGGVNARRLDVMKVRLVVDGNPEDVPPVTGEPPTAAVARQDAATHGALGALKAERAELSSRMDRMNKEFAAMRTRIDKIDNAIVMLS